MLLSQFPLTFLQNETGMPLFHRKAYHYSRVNWNGLCDHLRDVPWEEIFKLGASASAAEFFAWTLVEIDLYIPHRKYQIKPHLSLWFSAACAVVIARRNHSFRLYQQKKPSTPKVKFRQASNCCKKVLEAAIFACTNKTKLSIISEKLGSHDFWGIAKSIFQIGKFVAPPLLNCLIVLSCCLLHSIKQNCLLKTFLRTLIMMTWVSL